MKEEFIKFDFTEQDILDSFEYFMSNAPHKKRIYYLDEIVNEFLEYCKDDIIIAYGVKNLNKCRNYLKNRLLRNSEYLYTRYGE